jgi:hypothetical protein
LSNDSGFIANKSFEIEEKLHQSALCQRSLDKRHKERVRVKGLGF